MCIKTNSVHFLESISPKESMMWWSRDGTSILYTTIDNSGVGDNTIVFYGSLHNESDSNSLKYVRYKYPKAHQIIPKTSLWVFNFNSSLVKQIIPPKGLLNKDFYVTFVNWINEERVTVVWTPRNQNNSIVSTCDKSDDWMCKEVIRTSSALSLRQLSQSIVPSDDGLTYFIICLRPDSLIGSYYHISSFRLDEKFIETYVTYGLYDVTKLLLFEKSMLYFEAKQSIGPLETQHVYSVNVSAPNGAVKCLSCHYNTDCPYFEAHFSPTADYYALQCLGPDVPKVYLIKSVQQNNPFELIVNEELVDKLHRKLLLRHQIFTVISQKKKIYIKLLYPHEFDDEVVDKYSLIIEANNPENGVLNDKYRIDWAHYLVSKHQYIYGWVVADSEDVRHNRVKQNFHFIAEDIDKYQIAVNYIKEHKRFINGHKMCIWGNNIGAFATISALASSDILRCAVLVSPVINWRLMDAVTYEHMFNTGQTYDDFAIRFDGFNLMNKINRLLGKHILLIHGSADEIVPIQHSMQFIRQLVSEYSKCGDIAEPLLQTQIYPDEDNTLLSVRHHIYQRILLFFDQTFIHIMHKTHDIKST